MLAHNEGRRGGNKREEMSYALMIGPMYTMELAPTSTHGFLSSFWKSSSTSAYCSIMSPTSPLPSCRSSSVGESCSAWEPSLPFAVRMKPEWPRWLVMQWRISDIKPMLEWTSNTPQEAMKQLADIKSIAREVGEDNGMVSVRGGSKREKMRKEEASK